MFPWNIKITIKDDKNKEVDVLTYDNKYFPTIDLAKEFANKEGSKYISISKRVDLWFTVEVE